MSHARNGKWLIRLGAAVAAVAFAAAVLPYFLTDIFGVKRLAEWHGGDRLWTMKGASFATSQLIDLWHPWALRLFVVANAIMLAGWLRTRQYGREPDAGNAETSPSAGGVARSS